MSFGSDFLKKRLDQNTQFDNSFKKINNSYNFSFQPTSEEDRKIKDIVGDIKNKISVAFGVDILNNINNPDFQSKVRKLIDSDLSTRELADIATKHNITKTIMDDVFGFGPIQDALTDPAITEIMVTRRDRVYVEKNGRLEFMPDIAFSDDTQLLNVIDKIVSPLGRQINESSPIVDARLPDGSRVNAVVKPVAVDGPLLTIRKFSDKKLTGEDYLRFGSLSTEMLSFLKACVEARINIFVSGGTGSGKTTLLNMLSNYIPPWESIITIEDSCELKLAQDNVRRMESKPKTAEGVSAITIRELVKTSLRMRPDRIIVGEIRDGVVVDFLRAAGSGHDGSMSTGHANNPRQLVDGVFPILFGMSDMSFTEAAQKQQICSSIDIIVQITRLRDGSRKITNITEVVGYGREAGLKLGLSKGDIENNKIYLQDIFRFNEDYVNDQGIQTGRFEATGYIPKKCVDKFQTFGIQFDETIFQKRP